MGLILRIDQTEEIMNKEQIEKIIESLTKSGYTPECKTVTNNEISLKYGDCEFELNTKNRQLVVKTYIFLDYYTLFGQDDVDYINSISDTWQIYKHCICFEFKPKAEKELEEAIFML